MSRSTQGPSGLYRNQTFSNRTSPRTGRGSGVGTAGSRTATVSSSRLKTRSDDAMALWSRLNFSERSCSGWKNRRVTE